MTYGKLIEITDPNKLTIKQRKWLNSWIEHGNSTRAAREAGYKDGKKACEIIGWENLQKLKPIINAWIDNVGMSDEAVKKKIIDGLNAKETKFFADKGKITDQVEVESLAIQQRYADMAAKVKGIYSSGPGESEDKPLHIKVLDRFDGVDRDKQDAQDAPGSTQSEEACP